MTSHLAADDDAPSTEAVATNARRRRFALAAGLVAAVVVVAGAAATWHWRTHPEALPDAGTHSMSMKLGPGETAYAAVTHPDAGNDASITIDSASAQVLENSADARTRFFVCALHTDGPDAGAIGVVDATTFSQMCRNPEPVAPGIDLALGRKQPEQLILAITVNQRGRVRTESVDISYAHGWQKGTQTVAANLSIRAK